MVQFERIILLFFLYSFIGWLWETIYCSLKAKHFVYRGSLLVRSHPSTALVFLALSLLRPLHEQVIPLFFAAALLVTVLEYVTSYLLERFFMPHGGITKKYH